MCEGRRGKREHHECGQHGHHGHHECRHRGRHGERMEIKPQGAKTFRRKRAIQFLQHLETKEATLKKQLETPELQYANPIIVGELKATQAIIDEFVQIFELYEFEEYAHLRYKKDTENEVEA